MLANAVKISHVEGIELIGTWDGWFSMDQYPYREDAAGAIGESIEWLVKFDAILQANRSKIDALVKLGDAVETSTFLRSVIA